MTVAATALLAYCRAGFENECAKELAALAADASFDGFVRSKPGAAFVEFVFHAPVGDDALRSRFHFRDLVFARQLVRAIGWIRDLPMSDRVSALMPAIEAIGVRFGALVLETADTNEAKELSTFCRQFAKPLSARLRAAALLDETQSALPRLHLFFAGSTAVCIGVSDPDNSSSWPMGVPRLSMPRQAPSRSTQKLAEALQWFLTPEADRDLLHEGITAVDLGAAPGGWTWQLVRRGVYVTAVDNGPMDPALIATGQVEHIRADGFSFRPQRPVDWMVCDIVEQPIRVAPLVASWLAEGQCTHTIFNLKLPMKKRFDEVARCRAAMEDTWSGAGINCRLRFRQLYHDREEVTGYAFRVDDRRKKIARRRDS